MPFNLVSNTISKRSIQRRKNKKIFSGELKFQTMIAIG
jgi:hypothetical protein